MLQSDNQPTLNAMIFPPNVISTMTPDALRSLAEHFSRLARHFELHAIELEAAERRRAERRQRYADTWAKSELVAEYLTNGIDIKSAISKAAIETGLSREQMAFIWRKFILDKRSKRGLTVMKLRQKGYSNTQIAVKVGVSRATVARIIKMEMAT